MNENITESKPNIKKIYKENNDNVKNFLIVQIILKDQKKIKPWIIDNGCSKYMICDKKSFEKLQQYEGGLVKFGNNNVAIILGKGTMKIRNGKIKLEEVLFVVGLKYNLLIVI